MMCQFKDMTKEQIEKRIEELEAIYDMENVDSDEMIKPQIVELFILRDIKMHLDPVEQIEWALEKLQRYSCTTLRDELMQYHRKDTIFEFYNECTFEELMCLGY